MGFRSVYQSLTELFPQIDPKILRGVAIEHQHDADEAASLVISEIFPFSSPNSTQPRNKNKTKISDNPPNLKEGDDGSLSLSQWLQPSKLPHSYLALLNEESTPDVKPPPDYVVEKVVLPSRGSAAGVGGGIRTMYSSDNIGGSSLVKPSIRVQSRTNYELSGSSSKAHVGRRSSRKSAQPWSPDYSQKLRSWKKRNNNRDFSQLFGNDRDVPSKKSNKNKYRCYTNERERRQRIDDNIKALGKLLPHKVEGDSPGLTLNAIVDHVKLLQLQMKELSRSRLGEPVSHPMTFIEGYGHYIHHEQTVTKSLEEVMEDMLTNDLDAAANLLESKGLYLMPLSSVQGSC
ncbi:uncharacterized protein LOC9302716 isoform X2 [Arabidopsis lyrata subsp. lyrata]|uniref:uncharacterized protein LOC9302716 isoform X2 n=1 Tax=Arabidopsis lyrata subsp. lyrata TaxID=81972 RepID=UPI000A29BD32|nr:uncharacterized protein LOC9302716 isoform X2 [Arabidopsis lyrata subsp. lyrata]|eukprot:XP_020884827.1 uncharacterized protein LOC9302716 isoform X2 [Arabidopsis lyrata subsp. lyrata]